VGGAGVARRAAGAALALAALAGLLALAGARLAFWAAPPEAAPGPPPGPGGLPPDFYLEDFEVVSFGPDGRPRHRLQGRDLVHGTAAGGDEARVTAPRLLLLRPDGPPWVLEAPRGRVLQAGRLAWLEGGVRLTRRRPGRGELALETDRARVLTDRALAEADGPVRVRDPWGEVRAVGLRAELDRDRLVLLREVRGVYRLR